MSDRLTNKQVYIPAILGCVAYGVVWMFDPEELPCIAAVFVAAVTLWIMSRGESSA